MATISKGIKLFLGEKELTDLMEISDLGGDVEAIEITTLADAAHVYTDGIKNYGDSLTFKFLYKKEQFVELNNKTEVGSWKVELADGATCSFTGSYSVKLDGVGVNTAHTYTLSVRPNSEMTWA